jgi:chemotaxis signal transduction protein
MSAPSGNRGSATADALRREFDRSFAAPASVGAEDTLDLLALRIGGDAYAVLLTDVTGLLVDRRIVPVPTNVPEFVGLIGMRGGVVPVWSLGALLGYGADRETPRWMMLVGDRGGGQVLALAFERFDGHLRVPRARLSERAPSDPDGPANVNVNVAVQLQQSVRADDTWRGLLEVGVLTIDIQRRLGIRHDGDANKVR